MQMLKITKVEKKYGVQGNEFHNDNQYTIHLEYTKRDEDSNISMQFRFSYIGMRTLKKIVGGKNVNFSDDSCILEVYSSGIVEIRFPTMSSSLRCTLEFPVHYLVDAFRKEIEILRKIPFVSNCKSAIKNE